MNYSNYQAEDFATDESFLAWFYRTDQEAVRFWDHWLGLHPEKQPQVQEAIRMLTLLQLEEELPSVRETAAAESKLMAAVEEWEADQTPVIPLYQRRTFIWRSIAASVTLLCMLLAGQWWFNRPVSYETAYGETRTLTLPDGSTVILNSNSQLTLSRGWENNSDREVTLTGEGYFEVRKTRRKTRFTVHTGEMDVEVLGTSFNVLNRSYKTHVVLKEGSVRIKSDFQQDILMVPGEAVELAASRQLIKKKVNPDNYRAWVSQKRVFEGTPLSEVAQLIEENYGKQVVFDNPAASRKQLTGVVPTGSLDGLLEVLATTFNLEIQQQGDTIHIKTD